MIQILRSLFFRKRINPARRIAVTFALIILAGALLLMLPASSKSRAVTPFLTALFTSASATCVTGLSLVNTGAYFSVFGQAVILLLIQIGGLGFMTILCTVFFLSNRHFGLRDRILLAQTMGTDSLEGIVRLAKHVLLLTALFEGLGALLLCTRFIPRFGVANGIWQSVFHSVSAFCNAGFDIIGDGQSLASFRSDAAVLIVTALLIIIGGLGFIVWEDIINKKSFKRLSVYSRVVLITTAFLLVSGTVLFYVFERTNGATIAADTTGQKILMSFFQSVTTRTAGFDTIGQKNLTELSKLWGTVLMMIGGASGSTAGGVKVGTVALIIMTVRAVMKSSPDVVIYGRRIGHRIILHALTLLVIWLVLVTAGTAVVSFIDGTPVLDTMYEVASAYSTVGLSVGITENASAAVKILLIIYMYFGRVGIMTISVLFIARSGKTRDIQYPDCRYIVG